MPGFQEKSELQRQYGTAANLGSRLILHQRFSVNPLGWGNWVFRQYVLSPGQCVLELGCGGGGIWGTHADEVPAGLRLVLSDLSEGMLAAAREATGALSGITYRVIDAQAIPHPDSSFDAVIANHMLYHVPDLGRALAEIARVLRPGGTFYATTVGRGNLRELSHLLRDYDPAIDFAQEQEAIAAAFGLESAPAKLAPFFRRVELRRYDDSLHVTEAGPLADYVLSFAGMGNARERLAGQEEDFCRWLAARLSRTGAIDIRKSAGMLVATAA
ncbi:MAG: class I SAM-dependent methyltransferase [Oscillospiraceae bacterium]|jgi:SAM-dependent methyltransferase|nr:class I SAM-dependent methyltransferase [Oscillospiraceae bacterium]